MVAVAEGSRIARQFAQRLGATVLEGNASNVAERILEAVDDAPDNAVIARFMLRQSWLDLNLVRSTIEHLERDEADYVMYPPHVNYVFGCDAFSKMALIRATEIISEMPATSERSTFEFSPWALMEYSDDFFVVSHEWKEQYSRGKALAIRQRLHRALGPLENHHGTTSPDNPSARYRWASAHLQPGWIIADIASGTGGGTEYLARHCFRAFGIEPDAHYVTEAQSKFTAAEFVHSDSSWLREHLEAFDAVVSLHTLEHVDNDVEFLDDICASLKPSGLLVLEVPLLMPVPMGMPLWPSHDKEYFVDELLSLLDGAGFEIGTCLGVSRNRYCDASAAREAIAFIAKKR